MNTYGGVEVQLHAFLTSALVGGEWSASCPGFISSERAPGTQCIGGWVDPKGGLNTVVKSNILAPAEKWAPVIQPVS
jgi:hypothetical protein